MNSEWYKKIVADQLVEETNPCGEIKLKGSTPFAPGIFYAPYVPVQFKSGTNHGSFGLKTVKDSGFRVPNTETKVAIGRFYFVEAEFIQVEIKEGTAVIILKSDRDECTVMSPRCPAGKVSIPRRFLE